MGWLPWPCPAVFPELLMSVTFAKMHKALISARLTFTNRNPSVKPTHNGGHLRNQNRHICILWKSNYTHAYAHTHSQRMKTLDTFSIILSALHFQAFTFLFLWSRKGAVLSAVSTPYLDRLTPLQSCLDRNWWWEWKLHMFRDMLRVTETICSLLNNDQGHMLRQRSGY